MKFEISDRGLKVLSIIVMNTTIKPGEPDFLEIAAGLQELATIIKSSAQPKS